jgi:hypothetical protein
MPRYRIFTNDRGTENGVPLYSCYAEVRSRNMLMARKRVPEQFDAPNFAPAQVIAWPPMSSEAKEWLRKHVDASL